MFRFRAKNTVRQRRLTAQIALMLTVAALLLGQGLSVQHMAAHSDHLHTYADHLVVAHEAHKAPASPTDDHDQSRFCDLALYGLGALALGEEVPAPQPMAIAIIADAVQYQSHFVSTYHHLRPPSRGPPHRSKA